MKLMMTDPFTGKDNTMELPITIDELLAYRRGREPIQRVFPTLTPSQREFIKTGIVDESWPEEIQNGQD